MQQCGYNHDMVYSELADAVGKAHVSDRYVDRLPYSVDIYWVPTMWVDRGEQPPTPDFIVHPGSAEEVAAVVRIASRHQLPVIPYGGGSGSQGGGLPIYGGITLDLKRLDRVLEIDESSLIARVQAGKIGIHLEWELNERGLTFPHYPASIYCASVGGYVAARGSGVLSTKYGKIEDLVLALQVVLPTGEVVRTLPVPRHATGPEFTQLFVGSEGTLGVITEAALKLYRLPEERRFRALLFDSLHDGLEAGRRIMASGWRPCVIRLYDAPSTRSFLRRVLALEVPDGKACLILGLDGDAERVEMEERKCLELCAGFATEDLGREPGNHWWEHRYDFYFPPFVPMLPMAFGTMDTVTTYDKIEALHEAMRRAVEEGYREWEARFTGHFSHWYEWGTMVYARFFIDRPPADPHEAVRLYNAIWNDGVHAAMKHGGVLNEHHGVGLKLGRLMPEQFGPAWPALQAIKRGLDPRNIMNPGKLGFER